MSGTDCSAGSRRVFAETAAELTNKETTCEHLGVNKEMRNSQHGSVIQSQIVSSNLVALEDRDPGGRQGWVQVMQHWPFVCAHEQHPGGTCCQASPRTSSRLGTSRPSQAPCKATGVRCRCWWAQLERSMWMEGPALALAPSTGEVAVGLL